MPKLQILLLVWLAKLVAFLSKITGKGNGTSLPGLILETHFAHIIPKLTEDFKEIIFISGTNGKTTSRALLVSIYEENDVPVCTNRGGANLVRGIASSLLLNMNLLAKPQAKVGIFEVEEASLPILTKYVYPSKLILTNLFRDQLDAYGEVDKTLFYFQQTFANLGFQKEILTSKTEEISAQKGLTEIEVSEKIVDKKEQVLLLENKSDEDHIENFSKNSGADNLQVGGEIVNSKAFDEFKDQSYSPLTNSKQTLSEQLGLHKKTQKTDRKANNRKISSALPVKSQPVVKIETRPDFQLFINSDDPKLLSCLDGFEIPTVIGYNLDLDDTEKPKYEQSLQPTDRQKVQETFTATNIVTKELTSRFTVQLNRQQEFVVISKLPGMYNIYNLLVAFLLGYKRFGENALQSIKDFEPVFGRGERIKLDESEIILFLVKNPAGFDEILKLILKDFEKKQINLAVLINDNIADGKDVSWLWDVSMETFIKEQKLTQVLTGGSRGLDMLLRLKYAGLTVDSSFFEDDILKLVEKIEQSKSQFIVLATYTAMLDFREKVATKVRVKKITERGN